MAANVAGLRLSIEGGADLADKVNPRLLELTLSEKREAEADELSITLHNHDGALAVPEPGVALLLQLGWMSGDDRAQVAGGGSAAKGVPVGLVDKGRFTVDEVGQSGPPDVVTIRARSADLTGLYRKRRTRTWRNTNLGSVLGRIASEHGGFARIAGGLANAPIKEIEQEGKSDMAFVRDLGRRYDAIATWKAGMLLFAPIGLSAAVGGAPMDSFLLTRRDGWRWSFTQADREAYSGAEAQWHDQDGARRRTVRVGANGAQVAEGGSASRKLKRVYASEAEARQAAQAAATRDRRRPYAFEYELAVADPALQPDQRITLQGWGAKVDGIAWLVESVETTLDAEGLKQRLVLESA